MDQMPTDEPAIEAEAADLPEKKKKPKGFSLKFGYSNPARTETERWTIWELAERAIPLAVLLLGAANLTHALMYAKETEHYREQVDLTEKQRRYSDLFFVLNQPQLASGQFDQLTMHGMLTRLNELAEEPELQETLKVADFLSLGNLNGNNKWDEKRKYWYDKAYQFADRDMAFDRRSSHIAKLYHATLMIDPALGYVAKEQAEASLREIRAVFSTLSDKNSHDRDLKFHGMLWFANAMAEEGHFRSCDLNVKAAYRYASTYGLTYRDGSPEANLMTFLETCEKRSAEDKSAATYVI